MCYDAVVFVDWGCGVLGPFGIAIHWTYIYSKVLVNQTNALDLANH
jgi:hypothetical protein